MKKPTVKAHNALVTKNNNKIHQRYIVDKA